MPTAPPPDPYPPLDAVLRQLQTDAELWLPARLAHGRPGRLWRGEQAPLWQVALFALGAVLAFRQVWALTVALAVASGGVYRWRHPRDPAEDLGLPLEWNGWRIDVAQRTLARIGTPADPRARPMDVLQLEPAADWSLGMLPGDVQDTRAVHAWQLELRHQRRGPVVTLCVVRSNSGAQAVQQDVDALVDALVARLGIRRSGSRLVPPKRRQ